MRRLALSPLAALLLFACGSSDEGGLFGSSSQGTGATTSGGSTSSGGLASGGVSSGGVPSGGNSGTGGVGGGAAGGVGGQSGDAGMGGVSTGGVGGTSTGGSIGSGGNPAAGTVSCFGVNDCARPNNFCCVFLSTTALPTPSCQANAAPCFPGTDVYCDGPEDCNNGNICCGRLVDGGALGQQYNDIQCRASSECVYSQGYRVICGSGSCPGGLKCKPSSLLPKINVCSPN
ncbi:MAG: hypothetical protein R3B13_40810 [Polyangiaceae bacterium]